jgi:transposase-like protein
MLDCGGAVVSALFGVAGRWVYLYRAIDQFGQVIDVLVSEKQDLGATPRFFTRALEHGTRPTEVSTARPPIRVCSMMCCLRSSMWLSSTLIIPSRPITAD